ncbi:unnamed protein product, partial [Ixodes hexagonus]
MAAGNQQDPLHQFLQDEDVHCPRSDADALWGLPQSLEPQVLPQLCEHLLRVHPAADLPVCHLRVPGGDHLRQVDHQLWPGHLLRSEPAHHPHQHVPLLVPDGTLLPGAVLPWT